MTHTWQEIVITIAVVLVIAGAFVGIGFIPVPLRTCGATAKDAAVAGSPASVLVDGVYTCEGAGMKSFAQSKALGAIVFGSYLGRSVFCIIALLALVWFAAWIIYTRHSRRWFMRHTYKTQAPCDVAAQTGGGTFVYEPVGSRTCASHRGTDADVVACVCDNAPNLKDGSRCETDADCPPAGTCYAQRQPCVGGAGASHSTRHLQARTSS